MHNNSLFQDFVNRFFQIPHNFYQTTNKLSVHWFSVIFINDKQLFSYIISSMNTHIILSVTDDTGVSAKHLPMLGCHGLCRLYTMKLGPLYVFMPKPLPDGMQALRKHRLWLVGIVQHNSYQLLCKFKTEKK